MLHQFWQISSLKYSSMRSKLSGGQSYEMFVAIIGRRGQCAVLLLHTLDAFKLSLQICGKGADTNLPGYLASINIRSTSLCEGFYLTEETVMTRRFDESV
ncbi:hypothetical protein ACJIZ3_020930 [Penstemon smallii]|uniref:Uncharacterized protein n=1 Tax=Penstemon smallii TaxID=265156 RepID=A0ABD3SJZ9_9LAMI